MFNVEQIELTDSTVLKALNLLIDKASEHNEFEKLLDDFEYIFKDHLELFIELKNIPECKEINTLDEISKANDAFIMKQKMLIRKVTTERRLDEIIHHFKEIREYLKRFWKVIRPQRREVLRGKLIFLSDSAKELIEQLRLEGLFHQNEAVYEKKQQQLLEFLYKKKSCPLIQRDREKKIYVINKSKYRRKPKRK